MRVTLPIARASGRLVTWNSALILVTGCKYLWTWIRTTPIQLGFPVDNVMPHYHRIIALTIIVMGCIVHTAPQVVNYATQTLVVTGEQLPIWNFGDGLSTKSLLVTGIALFVVFALFYVSTLQRFRLTTVGFRLFWLVHALGITCAIPLLLVHGTIRGTPICLYFMALPIAMYLIDTFLRRCYFARIKTNVVEMSAHEDGGERVVKLVLQNTNFKYAPGQYAEINITELAWFEWHPFTVCLPLASCAIACICSRSTKLTQLFCFLPFFKIASAPNEEGKVTFYIKAVGRWTNSLYAFAAASHPNAGKPAFATVGIRGPFGAPAQNYLAYRHLLVVGSGIGVTPLLSIWKHLVGTVSVESGEGLPTTRTRSKKRDLLPQEVEENRLLHDVDVNYVAVENFDYSKTSGRLLWAFYASVLESMTVNICLFVFSVSLETVVLCVWMYPHDRAAATIQLVVSMVAIVIFGLKIFFSTVAYGIRYFRSLVFSLEIAIFTMDSVAIGAAVASILSPDPKEAIIYFVFFGAFVILHTVRIFHIFYANSRPSTTETKLTQKKTEERLKSVTGIWVSRNYSAMSFAAPDLVETVRRLSPAFSLKLFATRDKKEGIDQVDPFHGLQNHSLTAGRPDWDSILSDAIEFAHDTNDEGEAVGVFFCGSPAIAHALQLSAQQVTAQHQYSTNSSCRCRILVHKENF